ncbi:MAG: HNH endonuclease signature motif containing protein [Gemmatimonadetes bacterium]|nr:HNH endonuclease signature motif containing protein [Gemmatimonadota bacterium]
MFDRDGWRCTKCGRAGRLECHHVRPLWAGGGNDLANLAALCRRCHLREHRRPDRPGAKAWRRLVGELAPPDSRAE